MIADDYLEIQHRPLFSSTEATIFILANGKRIVSSARCNNYLKINKNNRFNHDQYNFKDQSNNNNQQQQQSKFNLSNIFTISSIGICLIAGGTASLLDQNQIKIPVEAMNELKSLLGDRVDLSKGDIEAHGKDFSYHPPHNPEAVVYPKTEEEVTGIINICSKYNVPIIPYGSGTSLEGHIHAYHGGVCIDFRLMKKVIKLELDDFHVTVQPGITYDELNEELLPHGYFFAMDPGPGASIGGMVGTSCSGTHAVKYGTMKDNVLALRVVLPDGRLVKTRTVAKKSSAGYDLTHLFIGAEGTLGVVTEVTLKIHPLPERTAVSLVTFDSIEDASKTVIQTMQDGIQIGRAELLDDVMLKAVNLSNDTQFEEVPTLIFEFTGSPAQVDEQILKVESISAKNKCNKFTFATDPVEREKLWFARKVALWSATTLKPGNEVLITDVCVPISQLSKIIVETKKDIESTSLLAPLVSHAGDGNFHLFVLFDPNNQKELNEAKSLSDKLVHRALEMGGTCTGEHGVALGKKKYLEKELGKNAVDLMKTIKRTIDPKNIMNPGKVIDV
ncbi:Glycolate oxidase subunit D-like protein [Heterostelium album PN500]|uniref:D-lactate dehydrogenase (cytochrome) n=1 Tax=Heterostelium pallidum (strain ATCC 26659 / Pp 5 / PN500) TaxID=670386 RepID=D3BR29_HETP5|nr:Glycolate oxidase subunit D-like protein [Heterostelium album PN500]EFA75861.1 Glycolate oxidase subunit D-like protein [Heterostelium album PN500]|eukprot:XP_020427995.1 Glycolate oxidase subunit D-like protein [Heterostelium album PN500]